MTIKVLFVCLGNICRSPMAEAVFKNLAKKEGIDHLFHVDSVGLGGWHEGELPHRGTREILDKNRISFEGIRARKIREEDIQSFDYIIGMDDGIMDGIKGMDENEWNGKLFRLMDFAKDSKVKEIPDPYYTGNFDYVYDLVSKGCRALLEAIKKEESIS